MLVKLNRLRLTNWLKKKFIPIAYDVSHVLRLKTYSLKFMNDHRICFPRPISAICFRTIHLNRAECVSVFVLMRFYLFFSCFAFACEPDLHSRIQLTLFHT